MDPRRRERLSKLLSLILRHKPERFSISLDERGYASIDEIVEAIQEKFDLLARDEILEIADGAEKRRFEVEEDRIRARYGHSFPIDLGLPPADPPEYLYYATVPARASVITNGGLTPSDRQYVHLSLSEEIAAQVARNQTDTPVVFRINARQATEAGVNFYDRSPVILTTGVPSEFIDVLQEAPPPPAEFGRRKRKAPPRR